MTVQLTGPARGLKLDFGCGQNPREGYEGVDLYAPDATHKVDLWKFPLPWDDNSVEAIHASHFLEHLPMREVEIRDLHPYLSQDIYDGTNGQKWLEAREQAIREYVGKDFLFAFMDECWRILRPDGAMSVIVPNARCDRAFQDPTHRRFFVEWTFAYFTKSWRDANKLDHYRVKCNFESSVNPIIPTDLAALHPEAQQRRFRENWNTVLDWTVMLRPVK